MTDTPFPFHPALYYVQRYYRELGLASSDPVTNMAAAASEYVSGGVPLPNPSRVLEVMYSTETHAPISARDVTAACKQLAIRAGWCDASDFGDDE